MCSLMLRDSVAVLSTLCDAGTAAGCRCKGVLNYRSFRYPLPSGERIVMKSTISTCRSFINRLLSRRRLLVVFALLVVVAGAGAALAWRPQLTHFVTTELGLRGGSHEADDGHDPVANEDSQHPEAATSADGHDHTSTDGEESHDTAEVSSEYDHPHSEAETITLSTQAQANIGVQLTRVDLQNFDRSVTLPGIVVERPGWSTIEVTAPMTGVVTRHVIACRARPSSPDSHCSTCGSRTRTSCKFKPIPSHGRRTGCDWSRGYPSGEGRCGRADPGQVVPGTEIRPATAGSDAPHAAPGAVAAWPQRRARHFDHEHEHSPAEPDRFRSRRREHHVRICRRRDRCTSVSSMSPRANSSPRATRSARWRITRNSTLRDRRSRGSAGDQPGRSRWTRHLGLAGRQRNRPRHSARPEDPLHGRRGGRSVAYVSLLHHLAEPVSPRGHSPPTAAVRLLAVPTGSAPSDQPACGDLGKPHRTADRSGGERRSRVLCVRGQRRPLRPAHRECRVPGRQVGRDRQRWRVVHRRGSGSVGSPPDAVGTQEQGRGRRRSARRTQPLECRRTCGWMSTTTTIRLGLRAIRE